MKLIASLRTELKKDKRFFFSFLFFFNFLNLWIPSNPCFTPKKCFVVNNNEKKKKKKKKQVEKKKETIFKT